MIKIALQKSGRLYEDSLRLLKDCGISIDNGKDQLRAEAHNFPIEVFFLRNGDIPQYIRDGVVDLAIIGENILEEKGGSIKIIEKLNFSKPQPESKCYQKRALPSRKKSGRDTFFLSLSDDEIPTKAAAQKTTRERGITLRKTNYAGLLCPDAVFDDVIRSRSRNSSTATVSEKI